ncbi:hypothetical protein SCLCIDRAFT_597031 [Scleroderma citrinum Foug A]|uniref:Uncharacterized protein n=1 Tax=Scleroderma citrinum Foug A TaxID=1036808 RepID=A0A0C3E8X6_9AGAM|nr:hypothetical protein SCLCIDRAFT_597031 [Scleroderma citrinum Foug A]
MRLQVMMVASVPHRPFRDTQIQFIRLYFMPAGHSLLRDVKALFETDKRYQNGVEHAYEDEEMKMPAFHERTSDSRLVSVRAYMKGKHRR